jgi:Asp-tRNA(Asn)/Glu-tRNA(Gln) amidotransferase C subunit
MPAVQLALELPAMARLDLSDEEPDELVRALQEIIDQREGQESNAESPALHH